MGSNVHVDCCWTYEVVETKVRALILFLVRDGPLKVYEQSHK